MKNKQKRFKSKEENIDSITNQKGRLETLNNKDDHKDNYKKISEKLLKERFDEITELTDEINKNDLKYYFKGNILRKRFDDFSNCIKLFLKKIISGEMKVEDAKMAEYA